MMHFRKLFHRPRCGPDVYQMSTIREGLCSQSGKGQWTREEQKEQAPPQSGSVPPSVVLRHQRHANAGEQARFSKSASLGGYFLLCHEITRVKETCGFVLASCGAKSLRCGVSHPVLSQRI